MRSTAKEREEKIIGKIDDISKTIHIHPALSKVISRTTSKL